MLAKTGKKQSFNVNVSAVRGDTANDRPVYLFKTYYAQLLLLWWIFFSFSVTEPEAQETETEKSRAFVLAG